MNIPRQSNLQSMLSLSMSMIPPPCGNENMTEETQNNPVVSLVVGTAGHIDHGKSSLIEKLTGTHPSRLKEEQERGMTIDIGYAEFPISDSLTAGIIDVPGHEKFIRNMVAGASGVDFVLLVIAADDGVMTQTREHLQILRILGVERGMTIITKIDAVDEELLFLVKEDIGEFLQGTFLEDAPIHCVSNITGEGIDVVSEALKKALTDLPEKETSGVFRMPVQRSFSVKGHGTVVTGVPLSGTVGIGDELEILPKGMKTRVRALQVHHEPAKEAHAGHRVALNLADVKHRDVERGDVIATRGFFSAAQYLEARMQYLDHFEQPLRNGVHVRFHLGTVDVGGTVILLDKKVALPGEEVLVQIRLEEPVVCAAGDPFVVRQASPVITLGGGRVLGETKWKFKRFRSWLNENIENKEAHLDDRLGYLEYVIRSAGKRAVPAESVAQTLKLSLDETKTEVAKLESKGKLRALERGKSWIHMDMFRSAIKQVDKGVMALHETEGLTAGFQNSQIVKATKLEIAVVEAVTKELVLREKFSALGSGKMRHNDFRGGLSKDDMKSVTIIEQMHSEDPFKAPIKSVIVSELGKPEKKVKALMQWLIQMGRLVSLTKDLAVHVDGVIEAEGLVVKMIKESGTLTAVEFKEAIGTSRKYVIPLLEYFDKKGITKRVDNDRYLEDGWEKFAFEETLAQQ
ncbi:MAG: selenocysteine-specific elongation factor [Planctomycetota bacterium]|jgi:selenocysteine-specific elongation factor